jgi:dsDNA-specific endonuclease/ATPase MutS2
VNKRKPVLNISTSNLKWLTRDGKINIKVNLKNSDIIKVNYYVNSKKVAGNSTSMVLNLSTFLGLRESNTIEVKVVDKSNRIYNRKFIFTMK